MRIRCDSKLRISIYCTVFIYPYSVRRHIEIVTAAAFFKNVVEYIGYTLVDVYLRYCINGIFEYTHPVIIDGVVAFIIFIGNILGENSEKIKAKLSDKPELINTLECGFSQRQCVAVGNVIETYIRMILKAIPQSKKNDCNQMIENIKNYVDSNLEFDIKISHVANIFHYNVQYIGRLFKKSTSLTFNEYVNYQRLARSKLLLRDSDLTVLDISNRLGFNNVSYFNRLFKKHYGKTPTEYRKSADVE